MKPRVFVYWQVSPVRSFVLCSNKTGQEDHEEKQSICVCLHAFRAIAFQSINCICGEM